jgi:hypothetical protein
MSEPRKKRSFLYNFFRNIPILGTAIGILNAYSYRGDVNASKEFAGIAAYLSALWRPLLVALILTSFSIHPWLQALMCGEIPSTVKLSQFSSSPGSVTVSIFPSVLGFGIGVYALMFAIPERLVRDLDKLLTKAIESGKRKRGSVLMLNSDLGYPLIVMTIALAVGVLQQAFSNAIWLVVLCWFTFWYAIVSIVEIIGVLFQLGDHVILEKRGISRENDKSDE